MPLESWKGSRSLSSSTLALNTPKSESYPLRRHYSTSDIISSTYYDDTRDFYRYHPWASKYYAPNYRQYYGSRYYPHHYYPEPFYTYNSYPGKYRSSSWFGTSDPLTYSRSYYAPTTYYSAYNYYPYRYWLTPSYYETNFYRYSERPYYSSCSKWYYPRRYYSDLYY